MLAVCHLKRPFHTLKSLFEGQVRCSAEQTIRPEREHSAALIFTFGQVFNLGIWGLVLI